MTSFPRSWRNASSHYKQPLHYRTLAARERHAATWANWRKAAIALAVLGFLFGCVIALIGYFTPVNQ